MNIGKFWQTVTLQEDRGQNMIIGNLWTKTRFKEIWDKNMILGIYGLKHDFWEFWDYASSGKKNVFRCKHDNMN